MSRRTSSRSTSETDNAANASANNVNQMCSRNLPGREIKIPLNCGHGGTPPNFRPPSNVNSPTCNCCNMATTNVCPNRASNCGSPIPGKTGKSSGRVVKIEMPSSGYAVNAPTKIAGNAPAKIANDDYFKQCMDEFRNEGPDSARNARTGYESPLELIQSGVVLRKPADQTDDFCQPKASKAPVKKNEHLVGETTDLKNNTFSAAEEFKRIYEEVLSKACQNTKKSPVENKDLSTKNVPKKNEALDEYKRMCEELKTKTDQNKSQPTEEFRRICDEIAAKVCPNKKEEISIKGPQNKTDTMEEFKRICDEITAKICPNKKDHADQYKGMNEEKLSKNSQKKSDPMEEFKRICDEITAKICPNKKEPADQHKGMSGEMSSKTFQNRTDPMEEFKRIIEEISAKICPNKKNPVEQHKGTSDEMSSKTFQKKTDPKEEFKHIIDEITAKICPNKKESADQYKSMCEEMSSKTPQNKTDPMEEYKRMCEEIETKTSQNKKAPVEQYKSICDGLLTKSSKNRTDPMEEYKRMCEEIETKTSQNKNDHIDQYKSMCEEISTKTSKNKNDSIDQYKSMCEDISIKTNQKNNDPMDDYQRMCEEIANKTRQNNNQTANEYKRICEDLSSKTHNDIIQSANKDKTKEVNKNMNFCEICLTAIKNSNYMDLECYKKFLDMLCAKGGSSQDICCCCESQLKNLESKFSEKTIQGNTYPEQFGHDKIRVDGYLIDNKKENEYAITSVDPKTNIAPTRDSQSEDEYAKLMKACKLNNDTKVCNMEECKISKPDRKTEMELMREIQAMEAKIRDIINAECLLEQKQKASLPTSKNEEILIKEETLKKDETSKKEKNSKKEEALKKNESLKKELAEDFVGKDTPEKETNVKNITTEETLVSMHAESLVIEKTKVEEMKSKTESNIGSKNTKEDDSKKSPNDVKTKEKVAKPKRSPTPKELVSKVRRSLSRRSSDSISLKKSPKKNSKSEKKSESKVGRSMSRKSNDSDATTKSENNNNVDEDSRSSRNSKSKRSSKSRKSSKSKRRSNSIVKQPRTTVTRRMNDVHSLHAKSADKEVGGQESLASRSEISVDSGNDEIKLSRRSFSPKSVIKKIRRSLSRKSNESLSSSRSNRRSRRSSKSTRKSNSIMRRQRDDVTRKQKDIMSSATSADIEIGEQISLASKSGESLTSQDVDRSSNLKSAKKIRRSRSRKSNHSLTSEKSDNKIIPNSKSKRDSDSVILQHRETVSSKLKNDIMETESADNDIEDQTSLESISSESATLEKEAVKKSKRNFSPKAVIKRIRRSLSRKSNESIASKKSTDSNILKNKRRSKNSHSPIAAIKQSIVSRRKSKENAASIKSGNKIDETSTAIIPKSNVKVSAKSIDKIYQVDPSVSIAKTITMQETEYQISPKSTDKSLNRDKQKSKSSAFVESAADGELDLRSRTSKDISKRSVTQSNSRKSAEDPELRNRALLSPTNAREERLEIRKPSKGDTYDSSSASSNFNDDNDKTPSHKYRSAVDNSHVYDEGSRKDVKSRTRVIVESEESDIRHSPKTEGSSVHFRQNNDQNHGSKSSKSIASSNRHSRNPSITYAHNINQNQIVDTNKSDKHSDQIPTIIPSGTHKFQQIPNISQVYTVQVSKNQFKHIHDNQNQDQDQIHTIIPSRVELVESRRPSDTRSILLSESRSQNQVDNQSRNSSIIQLITNTPSPSNVKTAVPSRGQFVAQSPHQSRVYSSRPSSSHARDVDAQQSTCQSPDHSEIHLDEAKRSQYNNQIVSKTRVQLVNQQPTQSNVEYVSTSKMGKLTEDQSHPIEVGDLKQSRNPSKNQSLVQSRNPSHIQSTHLSKEQVQEIVKNRTSKSQNPTEIIYIDRINYESEMSVEAENLTQSPNLSKIKSITQSRNQSQININTHTLSVENLENLPQDQLENPHSGLLQGFITDAYFVEDDTLIKSKNPSKIQSILQTRKPSQNQTIVKSRVQLVGQTPYSHHSFGQSNELINNQSSGEDANNIHSRNKSKIQSTALPINPTETPTHSISHVTPMMQSLSQQHKTADNKSQNQIDPLKQSRNASSIQSTDHPVHGQSNSRSQNHVVDPTKSPHHDPSVHRSSDLEDELINNPLGESPVQSRNQSEIETNGQAQSQTVKKSRQSVVDTSQNQTMRRSSRQLNSPEVNDKSVVNVENVTRSRNSSKIDQPESVSKSRTSAKSHNQLAEQLEDPPIYRSTGQLQESTDNRSAVESENYAKSKSPSKRQSISKNQSQSQSISKAHSQSIDQSYRPANDQSMKQLHGNQLEESHVHSRNPSEINYIDQSRHKSQSPTANKSGPITDQTPNPSHVQTKHGSKRQSNSPESHVQSPDIFEAELKDPTNTKSPNASSAKLRDHAKSNKSPNQSQNPITTRSQTPSQAQTIGKASGHLTGQSTNHLHATHEPTSTFDDLPGVKSNAQSPNASYMSTNYQPLSPSMAQPETEEPNSRVQSGGALHNQPAGHTKSKSGTKNSSQPPVESSVVHSRSGAEGVEPSHAHSDEAGNQSRVQSLGQFPSQASVRSTDQTPFASSTHRRSDQRLDRPKVESHVEIRGVNIKEADVSASRVKQTQSQTRSVTREKASRIKFQIATPTASKKSLSVLGVNKSENNRCTVSVSTESPVFDWTRESATNTSSSTVYIQPPRLSLSKSIVTGNGNQKNPTAFEATIVAGIARAVTNTFVRKINPRVNSD